MRAAIVSESITRSAHRYDIYLAALATACVVVSFAIGSVQAEDVAHELRAARCVTLAYQNDPHLRTDASGGVHERVRVTAYLPDRKRTSATFPYEWVYENPSITDPFYGPNRQRPDFPFAVQRPPRGFSGRLSPLIAFVLDRTDRQGVVQVPVCGGGPTPAPVGFRERITAGAILLRDVTLSALPVAITPNFETAKGETRVCASLRNLDRRTLTSFRILIVFFADSSRRDVAQEMLQRTITLRHGEADGPMSAEEYRGSDDSQNCVPFESFAALRGKLDRVKEVDVRVILMHFIDGTELRG